MEEKIIADNEVAEVNEVVETVTEEVANPQEQVETKTDVQSEKVEPVQPTETQRVSARIKEATEKARQEAKDEVIAEMGYVWNGKPIKTEAEYKVALKEQEYKTELEAKGLPDEVIQELIESRKFREKYSAKEKEELTQAQEKERLTKDYNEFFDFYKSEYGKDVNPDEIPAEVLEMNRKGKSLTDAFISYEYKKLKVGQVVKNKNEENANISTGSISGNGSTQEIVFTADYVANMTEKEMSKHWNNPAFRKAVGLK